MTALDALDALKKRIEDIISEQKILLQKEGSFPPEYVEPYVELLFLPHKNFSRKDFQVPLVLIGLDDATDDTVEHNLNIRLTIGTYGGGFYEGEDFVQNLPDARGYRDLINTIERIKTALAMDAIIGGEGTVIKPFRYGTYDTDMAYPYWYGYLSFTMSIPATEYIMREEN